MNGNIFKLKKEKVEEWRKWSAHLIAHEAEVRETLREEHMLFEGSFIFSQQEESYVCLYGKHDGAPSPTNLERELNRTHREKMKECFEERIGKIENLYYFEA